MTEFCDGCPLDNEDCPCDHEWKKCNWHLTFKETGLWKEEKELPK